MFKTDKALEVIAAWDAFETREPLDPRLTINGVGSSEILFDRAILHTRLAQTPNDAKHLKAAARTTRLAVVGTTETRARQRRRAQ